MKTGIRIIIVVCTLSAVSCLQESYDLSLLDYYSQSITEIRRSFSASPGSDMLILTLYGGTFQDPLPAGDTFTLNGSAVTAYRDNDTKALIPLVSSIGGGELVVKSGAFRAVSTIAVQAVKTGNAARGDGWTSASASSFGRTKVWDITYANGKFMACLEDGRIGYSTDGQSWTIIPSGYSGVIQSKFEKAVRGIAWGNGRFYAVGYDGRMALSTDGTSWQGWDESHMRDSVNNKFLSMLCIAYGGGRFVVAGDTGRMFSIWDDDTWNTETSNLGTILALAYGKAGSDNIFVAGEVSGAIKRSVNGSAWTGSGSLDAQVNGLAWGNGVFVAVGSGGKISRSTDGSSWSAATTNPFSTTDIESVAFGGGRFVAAGAGGKIAVSEDSGAGWTLVTSTGTGANQFPFASNQKITAIGYGGGQFIAAGGVDAENTRIVYSYQLPK